MNIDIMKEAGRKGARDEALRTLPDRRKKSMNDAIKRHGHKYDYNCINFKNGYTKVKIICPLHGPFYSAMRDHISGTGCPGCRIVKKSISVHGNKYSYLYDGQNNLKEKFRIICPEHGIFYQTMRQHLRGNGCQKCGIEKSRKINGEKKKTTEQFIKEAIAMHGDIYDYWCTEYHGADHKLSIYCRKHGMFEMNAYTHLKGAGCRECNYSSDYDRSNIRIVNLFPRSNADTIKRHINLLGQVGVDAREVNNELEVRCYMCNKWHVRALKDSWNKIYASQGRHAGENNMYCSDSCKASCPVFGHHAKSIDPRSKLYVPMNDRELARSCQTDTLKQLQCESHGYNYCEKCGDIIDVELHHTHEIAKHGLDAINSAGHILLCPGCHVELHGTCNIT